MPPEHHAHVKALFAAVVDLAPLAREEVLDRECGDDAALRAEVESLLAHSDDATLDGGVTVAVEPPPRLHGGDVFADRYRIVTLLGRGGMGEVYRAHDTTLDVDVALKLLLISAPARRSALLDEVRLARQVTHPAVCRVFDVDEAGEQLFFSMQYVDGENLASLLHRIGHLPGDRVRDVAVALASGLAAAHAQNVLHRDLKPSNIMLDADGKVVITDFGIATTTDLGITASAAGDGAGTPGYMAPEQLSGAAPASVRTDLYALGLVLYEAATGKAPFEADTLAELAALRSGAAPVAPSSLVAGITPTLDRLILDLLATTPESRPASAQAVLERLDADASPRAGRPAAPTRIGRYAALMAALLAVLAGAVLLLEPRRAAPTTAATRAAAVRPGDTRVGVAVLPFETVGVRDDLEHSHLVNGIHGELVAELSRIDALRVISRSTVASVGADRSATDALAESLGVDVFVEGRVRRQGDRMRLSVELVDARRSEQLWAQTYDRELDVDDLFAVETDVALNVASHLGAALTRAEKVRLATGPDVSDAAFDLYLRARQGLRAGTEEAYEEATTRLRRAVAIDDTLSAAHATLAAAHATAGANDWVAPVRAYEDARRAARRAIELDDELDEPYAVLGAVRSRFDWDADAAEAAYREAIARNPESGREHTGYAELLSLQGLHDAALAAVDAALAIDPSSPRVLRAAARRSYEAREHDRAVALATRAIAAAPGDAEAYRVLALAYLQAGRIDDAVSAAAHQLELAPDDPSALAAAGHASAVAGNDERARTLLAELEAMSGRRYVGPGQRALILLGLGEHDRALALLATAVEQRSEPAARLGIDPRFDPLRDDERFTALVERVGLTASSPR